MGDLNYQTELKMQTIFNTVRLLDAAIDGFRGVLAGYGQTSAEPILDDMPDEYFAVDGIYSALRRMRDITKVDLLTVSHLELSASIRFVYEMSLWFSFLTGPAGNGKRYFAMVALENKRHLEKDINHFRYEISNLRTAQTDFEARIDALCKTTAIEARRAPNESEIKELVTRCHAAFAKKFSIYSDHVKEGNFKGVADHVEEIIIPDLLQLLTSVEQRIEKLKSSGVAVKRIRTEDLAELADMEPEYSWLFSHTSRKIHAEPFSLQSDFSTLSTDERFIYIDYLLFKVNEMLRVSFTNFSKRPEFQERIPESRS